MGALDDLPLAFQRGDAFAVGLTRHQYHRLVARSDVAEVAPRVHAEAVRWHLANRADRHLALAVVAAGRYRESVLSHVTAALWHGLPSPCHVPDEVVLTVDKARNTSDDEPWLVLQRSALPGRFVEVVRGTRVTTRARTVVDCFRSLPRGDGLAIADAAVASGTTPGELVEVRRSQARWPGIRTARWGIGLVDGRRESWLESASVAGLWGWVEHPFPQVLVHDQASGAFVARVDLLFRRLRVIGEADGREKYRGIGADAERSESAVADRLIAASERADRLRELGFGVVRWGTRDLRDARALAARIHAAAPSGPVRADLACATCRNGLDDCTCSPRLCLPPSVRDAA